MERSELLKYLLDEIVKKAGVGQPDEWGYNDYSSLSDAIYQSTKILISARTLNRIFDNIYKGKADYFPQTSTRNALAQYIGFNDWTDFKKSRLSLTTKAAELTHDKKQFPIILIYVAFIFIIGLVLYFFVYKKNQDKRQEKTQIEIKKNHYEGYYPFTISLHYNYLSSQSDSVYLEFKGDESMYELYVNRKLYLLRDKEVLSLYFREPKLFRGYICNGYDTLEKINVLSKTRGWEYFVYSIENNSFNYRPVKKVDGIAMSSIQEAVSVGIDTTGKWQTRFVNFQKFPVLLDEVNIELRVKNDYRAHPYCNYWKMMLFGKNEDIKLLLTDKKCYAMSNIAIAEKTFNGIHHDLSMITTDFSEWSTIRLEMHNQKANFYVNNEKQYQIAYETPLDSLRGIMLRFNTSARIDYVICSNHENEVVYEEHFDD